MRFGPFEIQRPLGRGGMAETYLAVRHGPDGFSRTVCLKRVLAERAAEPDFVLGFQREAKLAAELVHPHIAQIYDFGCEEGTWWMALEYVSGGDLRDLLSALAQPMPVDLALVLAVDVLGALSYAHELRRDGKPLGIVHRDVSPSNILVDLQGNFKLADFGIAKVTVPVRPEHGPKTTITGTIKGKAAYMAPEQALGRPVDARADLWALGVVLFEALAARRPFEGGSDLAVMLAATQGKRPRLIDVAPHVPRDVCDVVERLLEPELSLRFRSASAVIDALAHRPPPITGRRRLGELVEKLGVGSSSSSHPPDATMALTALALEAVEPTIDPGNPNDPTRTRTAFDLSLEDALGATNVQISMPPVDAHATPVPAAPGHPRTSPTPTSPVTRSSPPTEATRVRPTPPPPPPRPSNSAASRGGRVVGAALLSGALVGVGALAATWLGASGTSGPTTIALTTGTQSSVAVASPASASPSPANAIPSPANAIPSPANAIPSPANAIPSPASASPANAIPSPANAIPSPASASPASAIPGPADPNPAHSTPALPTSDSPRTGEAVAPRPTSERAAAAVPPASATVAPAHPPASSSGAPPVGARALRGQADSGHRRPSSAASRAATPSAPASGVAPSASASAASRGTLHVTAFPWADVTVDGEARGRSPLSIELPVGTHRVAVIGSSQRYSRSVTIRAGQRVDVDVDLEQLGRP